MVQTGSFEQPGCIPDLPDKFPTSNLRLSLVTPHTGKALPLRFPLTLSENLRSTAHSKTRSSQTDCHQLLIPGPRDIFTQDCHCETRKHSVTSPHNDVYVLFKEGKKKAQHAGYKTYTNKI